MTFSLPRIVEGVIRAVYPSDYTVDVACTGREDGWLRNVKIPKKGGSSNDSSGGAAMPKNGSKCLVKVVGSGNYVLDCVLAPTVFSEETEEEEVEKVDTILCSDIHNPIIYGKMKDASSRGFRNPQLEEGDEVIFETSGGSKMLVKDSGDIFFQIADAEFVHFMKLHDTINSKFGRINLVTPSGFLHTGDHLTNTEEIKDGDKRGNDVECQIQTMAFNNEEDDGRCSIKFHYGHNASGEEGGEEDSVVWWMENYFEDKKAKRTEIKANGSYTIIYYDIEDGETEMVKEEYIIEDDKHEFVQTIYEDGEETVKMQRKSKGEFNLTVKNDINITSKEGVINIIANSKEINIKAESDDVNVEAGDNVKIKSGSNTDIEAGGEVNIKSSGKTTIDASGNIELKAPRVDVT